MSNDRLSQHLKTVTDADLAAQLAVLLKQYRSASLEPDSTQSIPNLDTMCRIADELSARLNK